MGMNKKPWLAALLNFFFMGPGYVYNGRRVGLGIGWTLGAIALTVVEQGPVFAGGTTLQAASPIAFGLTFAAVFVVNTCFAVDGHREARAINEGAR